MDTPGPSASLAGDSIHEQMAVVAGILSSTLLRLAESNRQRAFYNARLTQVERREQALLRVATAAFRYATAETPEAISAHRDDLMEELRVAANCVAIPEYRKP